MKNELTYTKIGDYYFPNIKLDVEETEPLNKYGRMRRTFLREHNPTLYSILVMNMQLHSHLIEVQHAAEQRISLIMDGLLQADPAPDKATDQMGWVQHMNCLKAQAEEVVFAELIYC